MIIHTDFFVSSMKASLEFYCDKLGFSVCEDVVLNGAMVRRLSHSAHEKMRLVLLRVASVGSMIELVEFHSNPATPSNFARPLGSVSILVSNLQDHMSRLLERGVNANNEIFDMALPISGHFKVAFCYDPDGNCVEFVEMQD